MVFEALLDDALRRGYVGAFRLLGDRDAARDACQEAASRALRSRAQYDPSRPFYPWFYRILRNLCCDEVKQVRRERPEAELPERAAELTSAEQSLISSERERAVARAVAALEPELREMIELRHFQDLSYEEMAEILDCPLGTVMSRLYRARKALRAKLLRDPSFCD